MALKKKNRLIFVVEDNQVYNRLVVSFLKSNQFTNIETFFSGEEALQALETKEPAIVVQDYLLGHVNGLDVLKASKAKYPNTEFIFLSGNDNIEVAVNTIKYGAYDYIVKDQLALKKLVTKLDRIHAVNKLQKQKRNYKIGIYFFFGTLVIFIILVIIFVLLNPGSSQWDFSSMFTR